MAGERASRAETVRGASLDPRQTPTPAPSWDPQPPCGPDPVTSIALGIKDCLCKGLAACNRPVCWCCLVNEGEVATADWCACDCKTPCCKEGKPKDLSPYLPPLTGQPGQVADPLPPPMWQGMAWVRVASEQWIAASGRTAIAANGANCGGGGLWRITFNFGVLRCAQGTSKDGKPVDCEPREKDAFVALADAEIMRWVVACCPALKPFPLQAAQWTPLPRQGACAGGVMALTIDMRRPTDVTGCPVPERYC